MPNRTGKTADDAPSKREVGSRAENVAARYLEERNYGILSVNYRLRNGEIDIIARDGDVIVFVEVKYRKNLSYGYPREAVNRRKQNTIRKVAQYYIMSNHLYNQDFRFDVIEMIGDMEIVQIENAF